MPNLPTSIGSSSAARPQRPRRALSRRMRPVGVLVAAGSVVLGAGGCSVKQGENPDLIAGKQEFVAKCGSCHTLARAKTKGTVGPNLDESFRESIEAGLERGSIRSVVAGQIENPNPQGVMPGGLASGATINNIASYVAESVARSGSDTGLLASAVQAAGAGKPAVEKAGKLSIPADPTGQLAYTTTKATATPGAVTLVMPNMSGVSHNIALQAGTSGAVLGASKFITKGAASVTVSVKPGTYTFFCQAPGHRAAGMLGTLTVK